jgi:hypothetical protein
MLFENRLLRNELKQAEGHRGDSCPNVFNDLALFLFVSSETRPETRCETKQTNPSFSAHFAKRRGIMKHAVHLRASFLDGNSPTGQYSDTVNITSVP